MAQMAFHIVGGGYSGFSAGRALLAFSGGLLYSAWCQGTSGALVYSKSPFNISNDVSGATTGDEVLQHLVGHVIRVKVEGAFVGWGPVNLSFEVFNEDTPGAIYKVERRPQVKGVSTGSIDVTTTFNMLPTDGGGDNDYMWRSIWAGNAAISVAD